MRHHGLDRDPADPVAPGLTPLEARAAAEQVARASYGRLLAYLVLRSRDVAAAEDALADALGRAIERWPIDGVPDRPEAWLLTVARRRIADGQRHRLVQERVVPWPVPGLAAVPEAIPDERLRLMLVCAHPAIAPAAHTPLMLQVVLGLDAARIAAAFLVSPAAMAQMLVRAKAKIRAAGLRFAWPEPGDLPARRDAVLEAVYAAFGQDWAAAQGLAAEAIWLARVVVALMPGEPEPMGLLALMLHCEARRPARRDAAGEFVPMAEQDPARWCRAMVDEAEALLRRAAALGRPGRFQLEAALQSLHAEGVVRGGADWGAAVGLYEALLRVSPTVGARLGHAAAIAERDGAAVGLALLKGIDAPGYQPWWALAARLYARMGDERAGGAFNQAAALATDPAVRAYLWCRGSDLKRLTPVAHGEQDRL